MSSDRRLTAQAFLTELGIAPAWFQGLAPRSFPQPTTLDGRPTWNVEEVQNWLSGQRLETALVPETIEDMRALALRLRGESVGKIAASMGRSPARVADPTRRVAGRLVLQVEPEVVRVLAQRRESGDPDTALGSRIRRGRSLVRLLLDGWNAPEPDPDLDRDRDRDIGQLWAAGLAVQDIAARVGLSPTDARKRIAELDLPARVNRAGIARSLGVGRGAVTNFGIGKLLPEPAGRLANGRPWWWADDIAPWAEDALNVCPDCGLRMVGIPQHQWQVHRHSEHQTPAQS